MMRKHNVTETSEKGEDSLEEPFAPRERSTPYTAPTCGLVPILHRHNIRGFVENYPVERERRMFTT